MAESESQKRYNRQYQKQHRKQQRKYNYRSMCKHFILDYASKKDIKFIKQWIIQRLKEL